MKHIKGINEFSSDENSNEDESMWTEMIQDSEDEISKVKEEIASLEDGPIKKSKQEYLKKVRWIHRMNSDRIEITPDMMKKEPWK